jgi:SAM-dependent methyltransferase
MYNNIKHVPFRPTIRGNQDEHVLKGSPAVLSELDGKISEFQYSSKEGWVLYKERPEKLSANSYLGADSIYAYLQSPISPQ